MKRTKIAVFAALLIFGLAACGDGDTSHKGYDMAATAPASSAEPVPAVTLVDGMQVVTLTAGPTGYNPQEITLKANIPTRFVITRTDPGTCLERISFADFELEPVDLPLNEAVEIEFTPTEAGTFGFVCGMGMQSGTLVVEL